MNSVLIATIIYAVLLAASWTVFLIAHKRNKKLLKVKDRHIQALQNQLNASRGIKIKGSKDKMKKFFEKAKSEVKLPGEKEKKKGGDFDDMDQEFDWKDMPLN